MTEDRVLVSASVLINHGATVVEGARLVHVTYLDKTVFSLTSIILFPLQTLNLPQCDTDNSVMKTSSKMQWGKTLWINPCLCLYVLMYNDYVLSWKTLISKNIRVGICTPQQTRKWGNQETG